MFQLRRRKARNIPFLIPVGPLASEGTSRAEADEERAVWLSSDGAGFRPAPLLQLIRNPLHLCRRHNRASAFQQDFA